MSVTIKAWARPHPAGPRSTDAWMAEPALAPIERLPKWLLCIPLVLHWFWLAARYRSLTLPSAANPAIPTGGLAGEGKLDCLRLIQPSHAAWVAPTWLVPPGADADAIRRKAALRFPLVAKPDIGWCGYGVRKLATPGELAAYAACMPGAFLLQPFVPGPVEAGLLYRRAPGGIGQVVALTLRHAPSVRGDGVRSIAALIAASPRLRRQRHPAADHVPGVHEAVLLTTVASLRVGGWYEDAPALITPALSGTVDAIARGMGHFHAGRFDVRATSLAGLQAGRFTVLEVNGAGAEAIGAWDPGLGLVAAFRRVFANHRALFALGDTMRAAGHRPCGWRALARAWLLQQRLARHLPPSN